MNRRARQAALRIMMLLEEFSSEELAGGLALLGEGDERDLPTFLARMASASRRSSARQEGKPAASGESRVLQAVKQTDPEKYQFLRNFEAQLREGSVLRTLAAVRDFGESLTKTFGPVKSRKEAVECLMTELASLDMGSARAAIDRISPSAEEGENGLRRFTNQLLSGVSQRPSEGAAQTG